MNKNPFGDVMKAWREDTAWRVRLAADPKAALAEKGLDMSGADEVRVAVDTPGTVHFVFPPDPGAPLLDGALEGVAGGVPAPGRGLTSGFRGSAGRFVGDGYD